RHPARVTDPLRRSADADERLCRWLHALVTTPGLTAITDVDTARRALLDDSLRGVDVVTRFGGPIVDVGSGGGVPGIPLAAALPDRPVTLPEANGRKCDVLRGWAPSKPDRRQGRGEVGGGAGARRLRRRWRKGAGAGAGGGRVVLAARAARRRGRALDRPFRGRRGRCEGGAATRRGGRRCARRTARPAQTRANAVGVSTPYGPRA